MNYTLCACVLIFFSCANIHTVVGWADPSVCTADRLQPAREDRVFDLLSVSKETLTDADQVRVSVTYKTRLAITSSQWVSIFFLKALANTSTTHHEDHVTSTVLIPRGSEVRHQRLYFTAESPPHAFIVSINVNFWGDKHEEFDLDPAFHHFPEGDILYDAEQQQVTLRVFPIERSDLLKVTPHLRDPDTESITSRLYFRRHKDFYSSCPNARFRLNTRGKAYSGLLLLVREISLANGSRSMTWAFRATTTVVMRPTSQSSAFPPGYVGIDGPVRLPTQMNYRHVGAGQHCEWGEECEVVFDIYGASSDIGAVQIQRVLSGSTEVLQSQVERDALDYKSVVRATFRQDSTSVSSEQVKCEVTSPDGQTWVKQIPVEFGRFPNLVMAETEFVQLDETTFRAKCTAEGSPRPRVRLATVYHRSLGVTTTEWSVTDTKAVAELNVPAVSESGVRVTLVECSVLNGLGNRFIHYVMYRDQSTGK